MSKNLFLHIRFERSMTSALTPLDYGLKQIKLNISESEMAKVNECIHLKMLKESLKVEPLQFLRKLYVMQEFHQIIRKKILIDKLNYYIRNSRNQKSFQISVQDLISKERVLLPFWKESTRVISEKLWSPIETDFADSALNLLNGSSLSMMSNSWFSTTLRTAKVIPKNYLKTSLQSPQFSLQETTVIDQPCIGKKEPKKEPKKPKKEAIKKPVEKFTSTKVRIYPNKEQVSTIKKWLGATRKIYNDCLEYMKKKTKDESSSIKTLRSKFVNDSNYQTKNKWLLDTPYDIKDEASRDLLKNYNSNFKSQRKFFSIKYKSKKAPCQSLNVLGKHWNHKRGNYSKIFTSEMKSERPLPTVLEHTCRLICFPMLGKYYICIPKLLTVCENQVDNKTVSIDPGVRTFATCYDPDGSIIEFGKGDNALLARLLHYNSKLQGRMTKMKHAKRVRMKKAYLRMSLRIQDLVDDCHKKLSKWLCSNYNVIVIPKLDFSEFKKISKKNRRKLLVWKHCSFVDRLVDKSREFSKCKVIVANEEFTSKTCGCCGELNRALGSSKVFSCKRCNVVMDRDANGARNILLKHLTEAS